MVSDCLSQLCNNAKSCKSIFVYINIYLEEGFKPVRVEQNLWYPIKRLDYYYYFNYKLIFRHLKKNIPSCRRFWVHQFFCVFFVWSNLHPILSKNICCHCSLIIVCVSILSINSPEMRSLFFLFVCLGLLLDKMYGQPLVMSQRALMPHWYN